MAKGTVDGGVRNQDHGREILALILPLVPAGAEVRVTTHLVKVDMSRVIRYNKRTEGGGEASDAATPAGTT